MVVAQQQAGMYSRRVVDIGGPRFILSGEGSVMSVLRIRHAGSPNSARADGN